MELKRVAGADLRLGMNESGFEPPSTQTLYGPLGSDQAGRHSGLQASELSPRISLRAPHCLRQIDSPTLRFLSSALASLSRLRTAGASLDRSSPVNPADIRMRESAILILC